MSGATTFCLAQASTRTYYEVARLSAFDEWWHWLAFLGATLALLALVVFTYRRDSVELPRPTRWLLLGLRLAAFAGLLVFFLQIEKRSERKLTKTSRAVLLVDTSQSMGLRDSPRGGEPNGAAGSTKSSRCCKTNRSWNHCEPLTTLSCTNLIETNGRRKSPR